MIQTRERIGILVRRTRSMSYREVKFLQVHDPSGNPAFRLDGMEPF